MSSDAISPGAVIDVPEALFRDLDAGRDEAALNEPPLTRVTGDGVVAGASDGLAEIPRCDPPAEVT